MARAVSCVRARRYNERHFNLDKTRDNEMGKGDKRTRRGKIYKGSYGKSRPQRVKKKKK